MTDNVASQVIKDSLNKSTSKDYTALYEELGNSVIEKAYSGDPAFEQIFESAWNKVKNGAKR